MSTQQPPPPPPGGQQPPPYGPPPGGQPPPYGPPPGQPPVQPYGPPPTGPGKSSRALVAVILIVALVVAGGAVGGFLLLGGDDSGETLEGDGYSYAIPDGWSDATSEANTEGIDSVVKASDDDDGFFANVFVEIDQAPGVTSPADIQEEWAANTAQTINATPETLDDITVDGQDAVGIRMETTARDIDVVQIAYLAVIDGQAYSIVMSASAGAEDEATDTLEELLDSWAWRSEQNQA